MNTQDRNTQKRNPEEEAIAGVWGRFPVGQRVRAVRRSKSGRVKEGVVQSVEVRTVEVGDGSGPRSHALVVVRFRHSGIVICDPAGIQPITEEEDGAAPASARR